MASSTMKRPHSDSLPQTQPSKRRKVARQGPQHVQRRPDHIEPAPQDPVFAQSQLMRSITAALTLAGFDSVKPSALEMFRATTEEYMLKFSKYIQTSMSTARRTKPTASDFTSALALMPNTRTASQLFPQFELSRSIPESVAAPSITIPDPELAPAPDFSALLEPLVLQPPMYIPTHFPKLPPSHAWSQTPVYPEREKDPKRMRERATEEGLLAEQSLRKLAAAAKAGAIKAEKRKENTLSGKGRKVLGAKGRMWQGVSGEDMFASMLKEIEGTGADDEALDLVAGHDEEKHGDGVDVGMPEGVVVNWDMHGWRRGGHRIAE